MQLLHQHRIHAAGLGRRQGGACVCKASPPSAAAPRGPPRDILRLPPGGVDPQSQPEASRAGYAETLKAGFLPVNLNMPNMRLLNLDPPVLSVDDFFSKEDCEALKQAALGSNKMAKSGIGGVGALNDEIRVGVRDGGLMSGWGHASKGLPPCGVAPASSGSRPCQTHLQTSVHPMTTLCRQAAHWPSPRRSWRQCPSCRSPYTSCWMPSPAWWCVLQELPHSQVQLSDLQSSWNLNTTVIIVELCQVLLFTHVLVAASGAGGGEPQALPVF